MKSLLFIPVQEKFLSKPLPEAADAIIFDLEDSVLKESKSAALDMLSDYMEKCQCKDKLYVRLDREFMKEQTAILNRFDIRGYMIPKMEDSKVLDEITGEYKKKIIALIETPLGFVNLKNIAESDRIESLAFGAEDYTTQTNMLNVFDNIYFYRSRLVMYAKAFGKKVYDTPSFNYLDLKELEEETIKVQNMGFDGKLAIHPKQLDVINRVFADYDYEYLRYVLAEYKRQGVAVLKLDGKVYELPHINRIKRILQEKENAHES